MMVNSKIILIIIILFCALVDQLSKLYINIFIDDQKVVEICSFIKLVEVWNSGISFGLFSRLPYSDLFFSTFSIIIICILSCLIYKADDTLTQVGFSLMVAGAIGNVFDRIYWGAVFDFISFHIGEWYWPAFNLADVYIVCGLLTLLYRWYIHEIFISKQTE